MKYTKVCSKISGIDKKQNKPNELEQTILYNFQHSSMLFLHTSWTHVQLLEGCGEVIFSGMLRYGLVTFYWIASKSSKSFLFHGNFSCENLK
jgi:hypothetical protein